MAKSYPIDLEGLFGKSGTWAPFTSEKSKALLESLDLIEKGYDEELWRSCQPRPNYPHGPPPKRSSWLGCCSPSVSSLFHNCAFFSDLLCKPNTARQASTGIVHSVKHARRNSLINLVSCSGFYHRFASLHHWNTVPTSTLLNGRRTFVEMLKPGRCISTVS